MEIKILEEFASIVETKSFQETADKLNISQSSLSKHIHKMEEELNIILFDRTSRSVELNDYSRTLYPYACNIVDLYSKSLEAIDEIGQTEKDGFSVAYMPILGQYGLIECLSDFYTSHPGIKMSTLECRDPLELLQSNRCDFAFVAENEKIDEKYNKMIFRSDHLAAILPEGHPMYEKDHVSIEDLYNEEFILHASQTSVPREETRKFLELCDEKGFVPNIAAESEYTSTILRFVQAGRGIAILNKLRIPETPGIHAISFYPTIRSYVFMIYHRRQTSAAAKEFLLYMISKSA